MTKILIIGATSAIAQATARRFAGKGARFYLLARDAEKLDALSKDLKIRGAQSVDHAVMDVNDFAAHALTLDRATSSLGGIDLALIAHGTLGNQKECEKSTALTLQEFNTNAISVISLLTLLANEFETTGSGTIAVISSVAGDRGRQSNYVYGAAKGTLTVFLQGLRNRLYKRGVQVLTIKPGFVDTPMTAAFKKGPLWAGPDDIAKGIENAIASKSTVVYLPFWWRYLMLIIKAIPESIFQRLSL
jgi:decaprenylphospho-beta-D-erythro-pentofuranosid-2-ulose 2-reductase